MRLFFDEDLGRSVPEALNGVGIPTTWVGRDRRIQKGTEDRLWIPIAGREGWLVVSANRAILRVAEERRLWLEHGVGGVFLTTGRIRAVHLLRLILNKLSWLEAIDLEPRPFAFTLTPSGVTRRAAELPVAWSHQLSAWG